MYVVDSLDKSCIEEKSRDGIIKKMFLDVLYSAEKLDNVATIAIPILSLSIYMMVIYIVILLLIVVKLIFLNFLFKIYR